MEVCVPTDRLDHEFPRTLIKPAGYASPTNVAYGLWIQPVNATHALNRSAGDVFGFGAGVPSACKPLPVDSGRQPADFEGEFQ